MDYRKPTRKEKKEDSEIILFSGSTGAQTVADLPREEKQKYVRPLFRKKRR